MGTGLDAQVIVVGVVLAFATAIALRRVTVPGGGDAISRTLLTTSGGQQHTTFQRFDLCQKRLRGTPSTGLGK